MQILPVRISKIFSTKNLRTVIESLLFKHGCFCASHPYSLILFSIIVALTLSAPALNRIYTHWNLPNDITHHLYFAIDNNTFAELDFHDQRWFLNQFGETPVVTLHQLVLRSSDLSTWDDTERFSVVSGVKNCIETVSIHDGASLSKICVPDMFSNRCAVSNSSIVTTTGKTDAIITYTLIPDSKENWDGLWNSVATQNCILQSASKIWPNVRVAFTHNASLSRVYSFSSPPSRMISSERIILAITYLLVFLYISLVLGRVDLVKSKFGLGAAAVAMVVYSFAMSVGLCDMLGVKTSVLVPWEVLPFLIIVVGVENIYLLTNAVVTTNLELEVKERVGIGLSQVGTRIIMSLTTEMIILIIGTAINIPALQEFCLFAIVSIVIDFFMQITFFVATLSIDIRRLELSELHKLKRVDTKSSSTTTTPTSQKNYSWTAILIIILMIALGLGLNGSKFMKITNPIFLKEYPPYDPLALTKLSSNRFANVFSPIYVTFTTDKPLNQITTHISTLVLISVLLVMLLATFGCIGLTSLLYILESRSLRSSVEGKYHFAAMDLRVMSLVSREKSKIEYVGIGNKFIVWSTHMEVIVWDFKSTMRFKGVCRAMKSKQGKVVFVVGDKVLYVSNEFGLKISEVRKGNIHALAFGRYIVIAVESSVVIYDVVNSVVNVKMSLEFDNSFTCIAEDDGYIVAAGTDGLYIISETAVKIANISNVTALCVDKKAMLIGCGDATGGVWVWKINESLKLLTSPRIEESSDSIRVSEVTWKENGDPRPISNLPSVVRQEHSEHVRVIKILKFEERVILISCSVDETIILWEIQNAEITKVKRIESKGCVEFGFLNQTIFGLRRRRNHGTPTWVGLRNRSSRNYRALKSQGANYWMWEVWFADIVANLNSTTDELITQRCLPLGEDPLRGYGRPCNKRVSKSASERDDGEIYFNGVGAMDISDWGAVVGCMNDVKIIRWDDFSRQ